MNAQSIGFIGGGRVARILLGGFRGRSLDFSRVVVSDIAEDSLALVRELFPAVATTSDNRLPAACDIVFLALHPPVYSSVSENIRQVLKPGAILVSLAPKITMTRLAGMLGGFNRIVRMIPNAPSIIGRGFNPVAYSSTLADAEKRDLAEMFLTLGDCPEAPEPSLEAYAVLAAMGPTYFWFQWRELGRLAESFGLTPEESALALNKMLEGSVQAYFESGLTPEQVMDLVPVKPLSADEELIRNLYRERLGPLYEKIKP